MLEVVQCEHVSASLLVAYMEANQWHLHHLIENLGLKLIKVEVRILNSSTHLMLKNLECVLPIVA